MALADKYFKDQMKVIRETGFNDKVQSPEKAKEYIEATRALRDKLRPIKTAIWRKEQGKE